MVMGIAALIFIPLLALTLAFTLWALGRTWPLRDRQLLEAAITGRPGRTGLPPRWHFLVGALFFAAVGVVALSLADPEAGGWMLDLVGAALGLLFVGRGLIGYTFGWRQTYAAEPFATLDRRTYSPVALFIGAGLLLLVLLRLV